MSPLAIKTYLNLSSSTDPKNANIELSINQSALFGFIYHCAGTVSSTGAITTPKGITFTVSKVSTGVYQITYQTAHPSATYMVSATSDGAARFVHYGSEATTGVRISTYNTTGTLADSGFNFQVFS